MKNILYAARPIIIDSISVILFAALTAMKVDVVVAAGVAAAIVAVQIAWQLARKEKVAALQKMSFALILLSAGATILTHDPRFVMVKPSLVYVAVGVVMLQRGWMLRYAPPIGRGAVDDVMIAFGYVWAGLMFLTAAVNLVVAIEFTETWPQFIAIFPIASKVVLFAIHYAIANAIGNRRGRALTAAAAA